MRLHKYQVIKYFALLLIVPQSQLPFCLLECVVFINLTIRHDILDPIFSINYLLVVHFPGHSTTICWISFALHIEYFCIDAAWLEREAGIVR